MSRIGVNWGLGGSSKVEWPVVDRRWLLIWGFYVFQLRLGAARDLGGLRLGGFGLLMLLGTVSCRASRP